MDNAETQQWWPADDEWTLPTRESSSDEAAAGSGEHIFPKVSPTYVTRREQLTLRKRKAPADEKDVDFPEPKRGKGKRGKAKAKPGNRKSRGRSSSVTKASPRRRSKGLKRLKHMASKASVASETSMPPCKKKRSCKDDAVEAWEKPKPKAKAKAKGKATPLPESVASNKGKGKGRPKGCNGPSEKKGGQKGKADGNSKALKISYEEPLTDPANIKSSLLRMFDVCKMKGKNHRGPETFPQFESSAPVRLCPYKLKRHVGVKINTYSPDGTFKLTQPHYLSMPSPCWCSLMFLAKQIVTWLFGFPCCLLLNESGFCVLGLGLRTSHPTALQKFLVLRSLLFFECFKSESYTPCNTASI